MTPCLLLNQTAPSSALLVFLCIPRSVALNVMGAYAWSMLLALVIVVPAPGVRSVRAMGRLPKNRAA